MVTTKPDPDPFDSKPYDPFDGEAYARDLMALRAHSKMIASYLDQAGAPRHQIQALLHSIVDAGQTDAEARA